MKDIVNWLIGVEDGAQRFYESAAERFSDNPKFSALLKSLALDERHHYESVLGAYELLKARDIQSPVSFDDETKDAITGGLAEAQRRLNAGEYTEATLMETIVDIEYSECNEAFLCVVNALKPYKGLHEAASLHIRQHTNKIEDALKGRDEYAHLLKKIDSLKRLSNSRLLVVDDEEMIRDVLIAIFSDRFTVEAVSSGQEAIARIESGAAFDAVICDLNMPKMDGIELYKKILEKAPETAGRILFLAGMYEQHHAEFLQKNHLRHIMKPASIKELRNSVEDIVSI